ncbi:MAG: hypothetical protein KDE20_18825, partial [Caldilineaceae bacterium]|nr:hypothetical protein [Caldilineaceae bacterium]
MNPLYGPSDRARFGILLAGLMLCNRQLTVHLSIDKTDIEEAGKPILAFRLGLLMVVDIAAKGEI